MNILEYGSKEKVPIIFSVLVLAIIGFLYFGVPGLGLSLAGMDSSDSDASIYENLELKIGFTETGDPKVFVQASSNRLSTFETLEGNAIPEKGSMVLGELEAEMMKSENLFSKTGDTVPGFFGLAPKVEGILMKTNSPMDYFHFLNALEFEQIQGDPNRLFLITDKTETKVFYQKDLNETLPGSIRFSEGKIADFKTHEIVGETYYPMILGFEEAKLMRSEQIFTQLGDTFEKFGKRFIVVGVLEKNNSVFDLVHIIPLEKEELEIMGETQ